jgi:N-acyl-D-aspartate/D-glutamate deacylase
MVTFDPEKVKDGATFAEPVLPPVGIDYVLLGGQIVAKDCQILKNNCGKAIRL